MQESWSAGDNIVSWCSKCKQGLDHTIVAMDGAAVAKVKCRTCGSAHKFRDPAAAPRVRTTKTRAAEGAPSTSANRWEAAVAESKGRSRPYTMDGAYKVGDCIDHERFGKGIVLKLYVHKCDVLFQDGERLMASGN